VARLLRGIVLLALPLFVACGNPADDKPEAEVGAPTHGKTMHDQGVAYTFADVSKIDWIGSKVTRQHNGGFKTFDGTFHLVDNDPGKSRVTVHIDATSIWSDNDRLTGHLKSPDFFDVATYPEATFESSAIEPDGDAWKVTGNLTMHGVTKSITFPASIAVGNDQVVVSSEFFIKRFDWNIAWKGKADDLVRDEVVLKLSIVAQKESTS